MSEWSSQPIRRERGSKQQFWQWGWAGGWRASVAVWGSHWEIVLSPHHPVCSGPVPLGERRRPLLNCWRHICRMFV